MKESVMFATSLTRRDFLATVEPRVQSVSYPGNLLRRLTVSAAKLFDTVVAAFEALVCDGTVKARRSSPHNPGGSHEHQRSLW